MPWVKRNLGLVIGGAVALVLMAFAGYYLWSKYSEDQAITAQLEETTQRYQALLNRPLHPGKEGKINNIELAKEEHQRLQKFLLELRGRFGKRDIPTNITDRDFRALLDNTIYELQHSAGTLGVALPQKDYWFTFAPQRQSVSFKSIEMLTHQLLDVKDLVEILYDAKIHDLKQIRRVPASSEDNNATDFLTDKKPTTNDFAITTPYELRFQGFSSELARVMEGLVNAKRCYVIRSVSVDKAPPDGTVDPAMQPMMPSPMMMDPRYGLRGRYGMMPPPQMTAPAPAVRRPPNVLLDENKLQFVLTVDAVRLREIPAGGARRPAPAAPAEGAAEQQAQAGAPTMAAQ